MSRLFFRMYNAGLSNCRMSADIGVGLAHLTGRTLTPFGEQAPWSSHPLVASRGDSPRKATVLDLFSLPVAADYCHRRESEIDQLNLVRPWSGGIYDAAMIIDAEASCESADFLAFRNRRNFAWTLDSTDCEEDLLVDNETLGFYSHFFYGNASQLSDLRGILRGIRPKRAYRDLARRIAQSLAPFNAVHIRRGDFRYARISPRAHRVTCAEITSNLATRLSSSERLVVCTDCSSDREWFAPLRRHFSDIIFLDRLILRTPWWAEFLALPFHDDAVLALITQLVAEEADCFIGTPFSSFTALIQRARGFRGRQTEFLYCYCDWNPRFVPFKQCEFLPVQDGPYSWNRTIYPVLPGVHSWFREWPEAFGSASDGDDRRAAPSGTVLFRACEASVHGEQARYERTDWLDNIGYWTNAADYVAWKFSLSEGMAFFVDIRYACAPKCAGTAFLVEVTYHARVFGRTSATVDWTVFSSWHRLGTIRLLPGQHTLSVRILSMPGYAAMNLSAVRLTPVTT